MKRLPLILLVVAALSGLGLLSSIATQGFQELARAKQERSRLEQDKARLDASIAELEATLHALRTDPEAVESMARSELGWIRPGERVVIIATPTPPRLAPSLTAPTPTPILSLRY